MWNNVKKLTAAIVFLGASSLTAQDAAIPPGAVNINLPDNSPLALKSFTMADSRATARGAALALDLHMAATLRNKGSNRIHGVTLRVVAQEVTLGGKGSVTFPSLNVGPGETFQVRIDMQLMRPTQVTGGAAGAGGSGWRAVPGSDLLRSRPPEFAPHHDGLRDGSAARPRAFQARAGEVRESRMQREMLESMARQSEMSQLDGQREAHAAAP